MKEKYFANFVVDTDVSRISRVIDFNFNDKIPKFLEWFSNKPIAKDHYRNFLIFLPLFL